MSYAGKLLEVDLTNQTFVVRALEDTLIEKYIGGRGLAARLAFDYIPAGVDPLAPENAVMIVNGPLTGTPSPCMRLLLATKSPASNTFCASYIGGHIGAETKYAGYDAIIIRGRAESPVVLQITNDKVEFEDASALWGKDTFYTEDALRAKDPRRRVLCIGPAGERLVKYALVNTEFYRHAGRSGIGAVFGSKHLKAVTVRGTLDIPLCEPEKFMETAIQSWQSLMGETFYKRRRWGTLASVLSSSDTGTFPNRNFSEETYEKAEQISGVQAEKTLYEATRGCYLCPIHCGHLSYVRRGAYKGSVVEGPEYETAALLGGNCDVDKVDGISYLNGLCDRLGLDTISTGAVLSFVMECCEKGILTKEMLGSDLLDWGDIDGMAALMYRIVNREGIGDLLAEGVKAAAEQIGRGASDFAMHVKGLEMGGWTPRSAPGMALCYATADRGADHQQANTCGYEIGGSEGPDGKPLERHSPVGKAYFVKADQDFIAAFSCLISCEFSVGGVGMDRLVELYRYATGRELTTEKLIEAGERSFNMTRLFNAREGFDRKQDSLPRRVTNEQLTLGMIAGSIVTQADLDYMLDDYYRQRGWDIENGLPTHETLVRLGIDEFEFA